MRSQDIVFYAAKQFKVEYCISGVKDLLHRLNYVYKKPKLVPGKADAKAQEEFVEFYKELKQTKGAKDLFTILMVFIRNTTTLPRMVGSKKEKEYLEKSKIELVFLPPYSPNLNLIERLWKYFRKTVLYNKYYETFEEFKKTCKSFFRRSKRYKEDISSLLTETENFQIIGTKT